MPWIQIRLYATAKTANKLSNMLMGQGAQAVTYMDAHDNPVYEPLPGETKLWGETMVTGLFDAEVDPAPIIAFFQRHFGKQMPYKVEQLEDKDWVREWMDHFHPMQFGERLWICPSWRDVPDPSAVNVMLDPGLAFGTGTHPTTALCLQWLDGVDLGQLPARRRLHQIGYLPQALPQASSLLAYEAMQGALRVGRPDLDRTGVEAAIEHIFSTLDLQHLAMRRLDELSGGQRQMVGLAQVVVREPRLMLLDEPTSALDLRWQLQVLQTVRALVDSRQGIALVALHDLNLALRFCNHLIVLGGGRVLAAGAPAAIFTPALLEQAYGVQARVERCSQGNLLVLADAALPLATPSSLFTTTTPSPP